MNNSEFITELYVNKNFGKLKQYYLPEASTASLTHLARVLFISGDYISAEQIYVKLGQDLESGYCALYQSNIQKAEFFWKNLRDESPCALWAQSLLEILKNDVHFYPSFFQLRSFLEIDLHNFIINKQFDYVQKIVNILGILVQINGESYKYVGRVFYNNGNYKDAVTLLEKSKDICYEDPEVHVLLAKAYQAQNEIILAKKSIQNCLNVVPDYYPALKFFNS